MGVFEKFTPKERFSAAGNSTAQPAHVAGTGTGRVRYLSAVQFHVDDDRVTLIPEGFFGHYARLCRCLSCGVELFGRHMGACPAQSRRREFPSVPADTPKYEEVYVEDGAVTIRGETVPVREVRQCLRCDNAVKAAHQVAHDEVCEAT